MNECRTCHYYTGDKYAGRCRRFPPGEHGFPSVAVENWCGEHVFVKQRNTFERDLKAPFAKLVDDFGKRD